VQEAADLVTSAADSEVNVIYGNVINENLKEEVIVTVIATGNDETQHQENNKQEKINRQKSYPKNQAVKEKEPKNQNTKEKPEKKETKSKKENTINSTTLLRKINRNR